MIAFTSASASDLDGIVELLIECGLPHADDHQHVAGAIVAEDGSRWIGSVALEAYGRSGLL